MGLGARPFHRCRGGVARPLHVHSPLSSQSLGADPRWVGAVPARYLPIEWHGASWYSRRFDPQASPGCPAREGIDHHHGSDRFQLPSTRGVQREAKPAALRGVDWRGLPRGDPVRRGSGALRVWLRPGPEGANLGEAPSHAKHGSNPGTFLCRNDRRCAPRLWPGGR